MGTMPIRILLLTASLSNLSHYCTRLKNLANLLCGQSEIAHYWDFHHHLLPIPNLIYYRNPQAHESKTVQLLAQSADQADVFVFGSAINHNSFPGILKSTMDRLLHGDQFWHNPVGLISHSRERTAGQPCDQLRIVAQSLFATLIPTQIVTSDADFGLYQGNYMMVNSRVEKLLIRKANELVEYSLLMRQLRVSFS
jgi:NAD(P)H-dependent FMN reductase